jgi:hypothetical protein
MDCGGLVRNRVYILARFQFQLLQNLYYAQNPSMSAIAGYINHSLSRAPFATRARTSVPSPRRSRVPFVGC